MSEEIRVHVVREKDRANLTMRYVDPITGKQVKRSTGTPRKKEASKLAAQWEAELNEGRYHAPLKTTWDEFRNRYEAEHLATLAKSTHARAAVVLDLYERFMSPRLLRDVTASRISIFQAEIRGEKKPNGKPARSEATIVSHLRHLKAALNWAASIGMLAQMPKIMVPKRAKGAKLMKGRPLVGEELERMLQKVSDVRPHDAAEWKRYIEGLWLSGLRLGESVRLSWEADAEFSVDLSGKYPRFRIAGGAQKSGQDQLLPMTPDFANFLLRTPEAERHGVVFCLAGAGGKQYLPDKVGRVVSSIGKRAGIVTDPAKRLHATAHDLRRSFGTRWAKKVMPATLQLLMRHASINTTMAFYVGMTADNVAADLWALQTKSPKKGTIQGTAGQNGGNPDAAISRPKSLHKQ